MKKVLVVSPIFHDYGAAIRKALEFLGYEVGVHYYDLSENVVERFRNKLTHQRASKTRSLLSDFQTQKALNAFFQFRPDYVLIIRGDALSVQWWDSISQSQCKSVIWLYDELKNMYFNTEYLLLVDNVVTYSPNDAITLTSLGAQASYLPLGFDSLESFTATSSNYLNFIGARYPSRQTLLEEIAHRGIPVAAFGSQWQRSPFNPIKIGRTYRPSFLTFPQQSRSASYGIMAGSLATLNLHGDQNGFTMRTFESSGSGGLQITDRPGVSEFFDIGTEVLVFSSVDQIEEHYHRIKLDEKWAISLRIAGEKRALSQHTLIHRMKEIEQLWA